jgi:repressor LexA
MKIGKKLKFYIKRAGLTQAKFAGILDVRQSDISDWVNDNRFPRQEMLNRIVKELNLTISDLIEDSETKQSENMSGWKKLKVIGKVPAGVPIEAVEEYVCEIPVPADQARPNYYALQVTGDSMSPKIVNGDIVVVAPCPEPYNGQIVVTRINSDGEVTLKKFQRDGNTLLLIPENPEYQTRVLTPDSNIKILGSVIALYRKF